MAKEELKLGIDLKAIKSDLDTAKTYVTDFKNAIKEATGISAEELTTLRDNLKAAGVSMEEISKITLQVQEGYDEQIKKQKEAQTASLQEAKDKELAIIAKFQSDFIALTDNGKKEVAPEVYKALLKEKEDALATHHMSVLVKTKQHNDAIATLEKERNALSMKETKKYYNGVDKVAYDSFNKIAQLSTEGGKKIDDFVANNSMINGLKDLEAQFTKGYDEMKKDNIKAKEDIDNKYAKKKKKLEAEQNKMSGLEATITGADNALEISKNKKQTIQNEIDAIDEKDANWKFDYKKQEEKYAPKPETTTIPSEGEDGEAQAQVPSDLAVSDSDQKTNSEEDEKKRQEQMEKRREYLAQLLEDEEAHNEKLVASKTEAEKELEELGQNGYKTQADLATEIANLDKKKLEEQDKLDKKEAKMKKIQAKIKYGKDIAEQVRGIISSTSKVAEGAAAALAKGPILGPALAAMITAQGAVHIAMQTKQLAAMKNTSPFEDGGLLNGKRHRDGGMRIEGTNIEVEGGEYVVNRESTRKNFGLIQYINGHRRELSSDDMHNFFSSSTFAKDTPFLSQLEEGGQVPMLPISNSFDVEILQAVKGINFEPRVAVTDIHSVQGQMAQVDEWVGM